MLQIHPNARTTPAVRAEIARSGEPTGEMRSARHRLAERYDDPVMAEFASVELAALLQQTAHALLCGRPSSRKDVSVGRADLIGSSMDPMPVLSGDFYHESHYLHPRKPDISPD